MSWTLLIHVIHRRDFGCVPIFPSSLRAKRGEDGEATIQSVGQKRERGNDFGAGKSCCSSPISPLVSAEPDLTVYYSLTGMEGSDLSYPIEFTFPLVVTPRSLVFNNISMIDNRFSPTNNGTKNKISPGTTNEKHRRCEHSGCTKWPLYAFEGEKAKYCSQHKVGAWLGRCCRLNERNFVSHRCCCMQNKLDDNFEAVDFNFTRRGEETGSGVSRCLLLYCKGIYCSI